jgi:hypothetical protein
MGRLESAGSPREDSAAIIILLLLLPHIDPSYFSDSNNKVDMYLHQAPSRSRYIGLASFGIEISRVGMNCALKALNQMTHHSSNTIPSFRLKSINTMHGRGERLR